MTLNNIKTMKKDRGFTIVELLIVIVVIAILAAIIIVAYQGAMLYAPLELPQGLALLVSIALGLQHRKSLLKLNKSPRESAFSRRLYSSASVYI